MTNSSSDYFGPGTPPPNIPFPPSANLTAIELLTFLPHCTRSADVIYRFFSNGATRGMVGTIINANRDLEKHWHHNSCGRILYSTMRRAGYKDWTVGKHFMWHEEDEDAWDRGNISVRGFRTPFEAGEGGKPAKSVPFEQLGLGVRKFPEGDDALDLTRMIRHAMDHSTDEWMYPRDYDQLLRLLGGPREVKPAHTDAFAFRRWEGIIASPPSHSSCAATATPLQPQSTLQLSRQAQPPGKKARGRPRKSRPREDHGGLDREGIDEVRQPWHILRDRSPSDPHFQEYRRAPPRLAIIPVTVATPSDQELETIFRKEGITCSASKYSAYAFLGPRSHAPYRSLHQISRPASTDPSGWAENLRWAAEQYATFGAAGWNESPEHMKLITEHRIRQIWASDEWLWLYATRREMEKEKRKSTALGKAPNRAERDCQAQGVESPGESMAMRLEKEQLIRLGMAFGVEVADDAVDSWG